MANSQFVKLLKEDDAHNGKDIAPIQKIVNCNGVVVEVEGLQKYARSVRDKLKK